MMSVSLIEKFDKSRYDTIKWFTISWAIWFGSYILKDIIVNKLIMMSFVFIGLIGGILFVVNLIRILRLMKKINIDSKIKDALDNEMYQTYRYKSFAVGFWVVLTTIGCFLGFSLFFNISAVLVCEITLYLGILSALTTILIFDRAN